MEIFRDIPGYKGCYQVSNLGNVRSLSRKVPSPSGHRILRERILKAALDGTYYKVAIAKPGEKHKSIHVHKLVAMAFMEHTPDFWNKVVDHINGDPLDNRLENLQLLSHRRNVSKNNRKTSSKFPGVSWIKSAKRWRSAILLGKTRKYLGQFKVEQDAADAYTKALLEWEK